MSSMFCGARDFDHPLDSWNTSQVTDMSSMFCETNYFDYSLNNWDTSNVTNMSSMFRFAQEFNQLWMTGIPGM